MTNRTVETSRQFYARIAGFTFLFYIAVGITDLVLFGRATHGEGTAAKLASIALHATDVRIGILLGLLECISALVLAVTLYALTCDEDRDLALLAMVCRVGEGVVGAAGLPKTLALHWLATAGPGTAELGSPAANALGTVLLKAPGGGISAALFAIGSTIFCYLLLRGRMIPVALAWLGVIASAALVVVLPAQMAGFASGPVTSYVWIPMALFEVIVAIWLLVKGAAMPVRRQPA